MEPDVFLATIRYYGEENILAIGFDNSSGKTFQKGEFTLENCYVPDIASLQFVDFDNKGRPCHVVKHVGHIQNIAVRDSNIKFEDYDDAVTLRG